MAEVPELDLEAVAEEQSALRRVATLVASEPDEREVFATVAAEAARVLGAQVSSLVRFDDARTATTVGGWSAPGYPYPPVPMTVPLVGQTAVPIVSRTGAPARVSDVAPLAGAIAEMLRGLGIRSALAAPIKVGGRTWGAIALSAVEPAGFSERDERRLCDFAALMAQAIANARAREQLAESRARLVEASDAARRRFERDLHDGAQQRLVALSLTLRRASDALATQPQDAARLLAEARDMLADGLREIRELARGLHPSELTTHGLGPALQALARRAPVPVELDVELRGRPQEVVESAVYFLTAEALANVAKYARATKVEIRLTHRDGTLSVVVADDGVGGADPAKGSGLRGLADRVEALRGRLVVESVPGRGTRLEARLPAVPGG